jgi:hypothetical protein
MKLKVFFMEFVMEKKNFAYFALSRRWLTLLRAASAEY